MIVLIGESASGKSTVANILKKEYGYKTLVSYTTRPMREGEIDGVDYFFVTDDKFNELKKNGFFAEYATYNGWSYGSAKVDYLGETDDMINVLTPHGLRQVKINKNINVHSYYIDVPRRDRLIKILERGDDIEEAYRRSLSDVGQYDGIKDEVDYVISNTKYGKTAEKIAMIIDGTEMN